MVCYSSPRRSTPLYSRSVGGFIGLDMAAILPYIQIIFAILLIAAVLLQQNEAGLGSAFGGQDTGVQHTRRGFEKTLFRMSIVFGILFALSAILTLII